MLLPVLSGNPAVPETTMSDSEQVYVGHVTELGETRAVVAAEDIHNQQGAKVVARGARIDRSTFERLVRHKLLRPIDHSVEVEDGVHVGTLVKAARSLIDSEPQVQLMLGMLRDPEAPIRALGRVRLEAPFAIKLTVARERLPGLFTHSLKVAIGAAIFGQVFRLDAEDLGALATAGLFHDIGELHIEPVVFDRDHVLTADERRQLFAHPAIAYAMLAQFPAYHPRVSRAVLEHHERADGSGYPNALRDGAISPLGRLLALSEVAAGVCDRKDCGYFDVLLRFDAERYGGDLVQPLLAVLRQAERPCALPRPTVDSSCLHAMAAALEECLTAWPAAGTSDEARQPADDASQLVCERLASLQRGLGRVGLASDGQLRLGSLEDLSGADLGELEVLLRESLFRLREIGHELRRRWPQIGSEPAAASEWLRRTEPRISEALARAPVAEPPAAAA